MYCSPVWSPYVRLDINRLETVQHKFLRYLSFKNNSPMAYDNHDYSHVMTRFNIPSLESQRTINDSMLAFKLIHNIMDCQELSQLFVHRSVPYNFRSMRTFTESTHRVNYSYHSLIPRLIRSHHNLPFMVNDSMSVVVFKRLIKQHFSLYR